MKYIENNPYNFKVGDKVSVKPKTKLYTNGIRHVCIHSIIEYEHFYWDVVILVNGSRYEVDIRDIVPYGKLDTYEVY